MLYTAKVTYSNGHIESTSINGPTEKILAYFAPGKWFNLGSGENDLMAQVVKCEVEEPEPPQISENIGLNRLLGLPHKTRVNFGVGYFIQTGSTSDHKFGVEFFGAMTDAEYNQYLATH